MKNALLVACFIALTVNQLVNVEATPPSQVSARSVCLYPHQTTYRCNSNEKVDMIDTASILAEVAAVQADIIAWILAGDLDSLMTIYMDNILYMFGPFTLLGHDELKPFIAPLVGTGGTVMTYTNMQVRVLSQRRAIVVGGQWSLSTGLSGTFLNEDWYKQDDGTWKILFVNLVMN